MYATMEFTPENALPYMEKRHYNRHIKSIKAADGTEGAPLRTRYTDRWKWRLKKRAKEPTYEQFPRMVYYLGGRFYITGDAKIQGKWTQALVRLDGVMWDAHPIQSEEQGIPVVAFQLKDGRPTQLSYYGQWMPVDGMDPCLEDDLDLNKRKRRSPRVTRK
jgi:hypothetical protein